MKDCFQEVNGLRIHYLVEGEGKPVIFLHGHRSDTLRLQEVIKKIGEKYKVYALDLPGFGQSQELPVNHKIENYIPYLLGFIRKLNLQEITLIGLSFGAVLSSVLAQKIPSKVKKVIFLGPIFDRTSFKMPKLKYLFALFLLSVFPRSHFLVRIIDRFIKSDRLFKNFLKIYFSSEYRKPEILDYEAKQWRVMSIKVWAETLLSLLSFKFPEEKIALDTPAILVFAENDQYVDLSRTTKSFSEIFPNPKVIIIPGFKHMPKGDISQILNLPEIRKLFDLI